MICAAHAAFAFTLPRTANRGQRPLTVCIVAKRRSDGQLATAAFAAIPGGLVGHFAGTLCAVVTRGLASGAAPALSAAGIGLFLSNRGRRSGRCSARRLGGTFDALFARGGFSSDLGSLFLGAATGFGLLALTGFLLLALLFVTQAILGSFLALVILRAGSLFGLALFKHFLARFQLCNGDAELGSERNQLGFHCITCRRRCGARVSATTLPATGRHRAALLGLDDHLFGAPMAEALLDRAGSLPNHSQRLAPTGIALIVRIAHSSYISHITPKHLCVPAVSVIGPFPGTRSALVPPEIR